MKLHDQLITLRNKQSLFEGMRPGGEWIPIIEHPIKITRLFGRDKKACEVRLRFLDIFTRKRKSISFFRPISTYSP